MACTQHWPHLTASQNPLMALPCNEMVYFPFWWMFLTSRDIVALVDKSHNFRVDAIWQCNAAIFMQFLGLGNNSSFGVIIVGVPMLQLPNDTKSNHRFSTFGTRWFGVRGSEGDTEHGNEERKSWFLSRDVVFFSCWTIFLLMNTRRMYCKSEISFGRSTHYS